MYLGQGHYSHLYVTEEKGGREDILEVREDRKNWRQAAGGRKQVGERGRNDASESERKEKREGEVSEKRNNEEHKNWERKLI